MIVAVSVCVGVMVKVSDGCRVAVSNMMTLVTIGEGEGVKVGLLLAIFPTRRTTNPKQ